METASVYSVFVKENMSGGHICVFESGLIDEACAFALSLFHSVNVRDINILVVRDSVDLIEFKRN